MFTLLLQLHQSIQLNTHLTEPQIFNLSEYCVNTFLLLYRESRLVRYIYQTAQLSSEAHRAAHLLVFLYSTSLTHICWLCKLGFRLIVNILTIDNSIVGFHSSWIWQHLIACPKNLIDCPKNLIDCPKNLCSKAFCLFLPQFPFSYLRPMELKQNWSATEPHTEQNKLIELGDTIVFDVKHCQFLVKV